MYQQTTNKLVVAGVDQPNETLAPFLRLHLTKKKRHFKRKPCSTSKPRPPFPPPGWRRLAMTLQKRTRLSPHDLEHHGTVSSPPLSFYVLAVPAMVVELITLCGVESLDSAQGGDIT